MDKIIFDSDNISEDGYWSDVLYEEQMRDLNAFFHQLIEDYEKRYRTSVENIALVGRVGLWNGSPIGGKIIDVKDNPLNHMGRVDRVYVTIDESGLLTFNGAHHDGTHRMNLYLLTENKLRKTIPSYLHYGEYDYQDMEKIYEELSPLKVSKRVELSYYSAQAS